jgi:hypothetical protein
MISSSYQPPRFRELREYRLEADIEDIFIQDICCVRNLPPQADTVRSVGLTYGGPDLVCQNSAGEVLFPNEIKRPSLLRLGNIDYPTAYIHQGSSDTRTGRAVKTAVWLHVLEWAPVWCLIYLRADMVCKAGQRKKHCRFPDHRLQQE